MSDLGLLTPRDQDPDDSFVVVKEGPPEEMGRVARWIEMLFKAVSPPAAPAAGGVKLYGATDWAGRLHPSYMGPDGVAYPIKPDWSLPLFFAYNDLVSASTTPHFVFANSGTGSGFASLASPVNSIGWVRFSTGTTVSGRALMMDGNNNTASNTIRFDFGPARFAMGIRTGPDLSNVTDTYIVRIGFHESNSNDPADGAYFRYRYDQNGGRWQAVTRSGSAETSIDTGVAYSINKIQELEVVSDAAGSVFFYIDGVLVATSTTNIPTGAGRETGYGLTIVKTAGTVNRFIDADYMVVEQYLARS